MNEMMMELTLRSVHSKLNRIYKYDVFFLNV